MVGNITFYANFRQKGASPTNHCWCQSGNEWLPFRVVSLQCIIWFCQSTCVTDRLNYDSQDHASIAASHGRNDIFSTTTTLQSIQPVELYLEGSTLLLDEKTYSQSTEMIYLSSET